MEIEIDPRMARRCAESFGCDDPESAVRRAVRLVAEMENADEVRPATPGSGDDSDREDARS